MYISCVGWLIPRGNFLLFAGFSGCKSHDAKVIVTRDGHSGSQLPCLAPAESGRCLGIYGHLKKVSAHYTCARICVTLVTPFSVANINGGKHAAESADSKGWSTGYLFAWIRKCSKKRLHNAHLFQSGLVDTVGQLDTASAVPCESLAPMSTATRVRLTKTRAHT